MRFLAIIPILVFSLSACQTVKPMVKSSTKKNAIILLDDGVKQTEILGYSMDSNKLGVHEPIIFTTLDGKVVCKGKYTLQSQYMPGRLSMSCFDGRIQGDGTFQVKGRRGIVSYGVGELTTKKEKLKIVFGMTHQEFEARRMALANK